MTRENLQKTLRRERAAHERYMAHIERLVAANKARHAVYMERARLAGMLIGLGAFDAAAQQPSRGDGSARARGGAG